MGELDPNLIGNTPELTPGGLYGSGSPGDDQSEIEHGQRETLLTLGIDRVPLPGELQITEALKTLAPTYRMQDYYGVVGDTQRQVDLPVLAGGLDMWILERVTAWGNPANVADVTIRLGERGVAGGLMFKIPALLTAPKGSIASVTIGLPVDGPQVTGMTFNGTAGDQAAVIFVYKRG